MITILCFLAGLLIFICCWFAAYIYEEDVTGCSGAIDYVPASVARQLETELAAATQNLLNSHRRSIGGQQMNTTPRTDAATYPADCLGKTLVVHRDCAAALEVELKEAEQIDNAVNHYLSRAEKAEAELAVSEFERMEQARLLGKSGSREAALLAELANEREKVKVLLTALENYKNRVIAGGTNPARSAIDAAMKEDSK